MKKNIKVILSLVFSILLIFGATPITGELLSMNGMQLKVSAASPIVMTSTVTTGNNHALAIKTDNSLWAWGDNSYGQLGDGTTTNRKVPVKIMTNVQSVYAKGNFTLAIKTDGTLWAWGDNTDGQTGSGSQKDMLMKPVKIMSGVTTASAGQNHSLAVKDDGTLWAWGDDSEGKLGIGESEYYSQYTPVYVTNNAVSVWAGGCQSIALKADNSVWGWGNNWFGAVGAGGDTVKKPVKLNLSAIKLITTGKNHTFGIKTDGSLWGWGVNEYGQVWSNAKEYGKYQPTEYYTPFLIPNMENIEYVSAGSAHSAAVKKDGTLWTWGINYNGQLGDGTKITRGIPAQVNNISGVIAAFAENGYTLALQTNGTLWSWGSNERGKLGTGKTSDSLIPVSIMSNVKLPSAVPKKTVSSIKIKTLPSLLTYTKGKNLNLSGGSITVSYSNKTSVVLPMASYMVSGYDKNKLGTQTITITYMGKSTTFTVSVKTGATKVTLPTALAVTMGKSATLKATITPSTADTNVKWESLDKTIATISSTGVVKGIRPGKVTIMATAPSGKYNYCTVTVHRYVSLRVGYKTAIQNGNKTTIDKAGTKPIKIKGKTMVPVRFVAEKMGAKVTYINDKEPITITYEDIEVKITLGKEFISVQHDNEWIPRRYKLDVPAQKYKGKTFIPLRAIGEALDFHVHYEAKGEYIIVNNPAMNTSLRNARLIEARKYIK